MAQQTTFGLNCALMTPFMASGEIDIQLFLKHARRTLDGGCDSITLFGTTGEGPMVASAEREAALAAFASAGFDMRREIVGGVLAVTATDAATQAASCYSHDCKAVLLAPPFYFPEPTEEGAFAWYADVFRRLGAQARDIILYHIPQFTGVPLTVALVARLAKAFPGVVKGVEDSRGVREETLERVRAHRDLAILVGAESDVAAAVRLGGQGTICGFANFIPGSLRQVAHEGREHPDVARLEGVIAGVHFLGAFKALMASIHDEPGWLNFRPPLAPLAKADAAKVVSRWTAAFGKKAA